MNMILAIDTLGSRYGKLPSEILSQATTFDLVIMDAAMTYINQRSKQTSGELPDYTPEQLMKIRNSVK